MKVLAAGVAALMIAPVATLSLLAGTFAASNSIDGDCSSAPIPTATGAGENSSAGVRRDCGPNRDLAPARAFHGLDVYVSDPTSSGRITRRMLHAFNEVNRVFNAWPWGIACWSPHPWNPTSDHPIGRACDFTVGQIGRFPTPVKRQVGWQLAHWAQANASTLSIRYIIWDGHVWSPARSHEGWRSYGGAGIYDPVAPTGGHFDHVHISVTPNSA